MIRAKRYQSAIAALLLLWAGAASARPTADRIAVLQRGVNVTHWFRFPPNRSPAVLANYLSDADLRRLRRAGFTFLRIPVQPDVAAAAPEALIRALERIERQGLGVVVALAPEGWHLETEAADRAALLAFWRGLAPRLRVLPADRTFPEILNEPVFPNDAAGWSALQRQALAVIRAALPGNTVIVTGNDWGSVAGLLALSPVADRNVIYSIHFYDPVELTSLAAWNPSLDHAAFAALPFPVTNPASCDAGLPRTDAASMAAWRYYCASGWNDGAIDATFTRVGAWAHRNDAWVLLGEFGATERLNRPSRVAWLAAVRHAAAGQGFGWALWGYDDVMGFRARPGERLDEDTLGALGLGQ